MLTTEIVGKNLKCFKRFDNYNTLIVLCVLYNNNTTYFYKNSTL